MKYILIPLILVVYDFSLSSGNTCSTVCNCKWKGNKLTFECDNKELTQIPKGLDPGTQILDLSYNKLQFLPENAFQRYGLVNLQKIFLKSCELEQISENAFIELTNLIELDLSHNLLIQIPYTVFKSTPSLRELDFSNNPITKIAKNTFSFTPYLVHLDLSHCDISNIDPHSFRYLTQVLTIQLQYNKLQELPKEAIKSLNSSHTLQLHNNPWICDCRGLPLFKLLEEQRMPITPTCQYPSRVRGKAFKDLKEDDFACQPKVTTEGQLIHATAGENTTATCETRGQPPPKVRWYVKNKEVINGTVLGLGPQKAYIFSSKYKSILVITRAHEDNSGVITCIAENPAGIDTGNFTLLVNLKVLSSTSLQTGHIAGISIGLVICALILLVVAFLVFAKSRSSRSSTPSKNRNCQIVTSEPNPVQKPPRMTELNGSNSTDPDIISEVDRSNRNALNHNGHLPNGKLNTTSLTEAGDYTRMEGDSLYPSGIWEGERPPAHEHFNPGFVSQESPMHNSIHSGLQGPLHSTPYKSSDDPQIYGYPSDYGLPIPEVYPESIYSSRQELQNSLHSGSNRHSLYSSGQDIFGSKQDMYSSKSELGSHQLSHHGTHPREDIYQERSIYAIKQPIYESPQRKQISPKHQQDIYSPFHQQKYSGLYRVDENPDIRESDIAEGAEIPSSRDPPGERPWIPGCQGAPAVPMGVPVLPPLPNSNIHRIKPRDSPDEGYQEGTDV